jgi:hypothetical protein
MISIDIIFITQSFMPHIMGIRCDEIEDSMVVGDVEELVDFGVEH